MSTGRRGDDLELEDAIDREWRKGSSEEPPARADEAILVAARARRRRVAAWQPLAAAATVAAVALLLVQLGSHEQATESTLQGTPESAPASSPAAPSAKTAAAESSEVTRDAAAPSFGAGALEGARSGLMVGESAEQWAARIAALHDSGDLDTAATELRAFRAARADADRFLPDSLESWAAGIK